jgi:hypothetical protein
LTAGEPTAYPSGQVLEALVGYDIALNPGEPRIWEILELGFPPGIVLTSGLWSSAPEQPPAADLPRDLVSLILQAKRPQRLDHWRAGQNHYWRGPYYRFYIEEGQQTQLAALEKGVAGQAVVRYASAAFLQLDALYNHQRARLVAHRSAFVAPETLQGHRLWSYAEPGIVGFVNQEGFEARADTAETLVASLRERATYQTLNEHVQELAEGAGVDVGPDLWIDRLAARADQPPERRRAALLAWAAFAQRVAQLRAEWLVVDLTA